METTKITEALQAGNQLRNPEVWKHTQAALPAVTTLIGTIVWALKVFGVNIHLTDEQIALIALGVLLLVSAVNAIITYATSVKVGLKAKDGG